MVVLKLEKETDFIPWLRQHSDKPVLVKFFTTWCGPCRVLQRNLEKLLVERKENKQPDLVVLAVDADLFPQLKYLDSDQNTQCLVIYNVPVLFLFREGKMLKKATGSMSVQELKEFINI